MTQPDPPAMRATPLDAFLFSCKTALSAVLAYVVYGGFHLPGAAWAAPVSAVIISQPDRKSVV